MPGYLKRNDIRVRPRVARNGSLAVSAADAARIAVSDPRVSFVSENDYIRLAGGGRSPGMSGASSKKKFAQAVGDANAAAQQYAAAVARGELFPTTGAEGGFCSTPGTCAQDANDPTMLYATKGPMGFTVAPNGFQIAGPSAWKGSGQWFGQTPLEAALAKLNPPAPTPAPPPLPTIAPAPTPVPTPQPAPAPIQQTQAPPMVYQSQPEPAPITKLPDPVAARNYEMIQQQPPELTPPAPVVQAPTPPPQSTATYPVGPSPASDIPGAVDFSGSGRSAGGGGGFMVNESGQQVAPAPSGPAPSESMLTPKNVLIGAALLVGGYMAWQKFGKRRR